MTSRANHVVHRLLVGSLTFSPARYFQGADPPQGDVPPVYWGADRSALSEDRQRRQ